ncbi:MAG TPA: heme-binding protein [Sphingomonas sp.]|nr:heme-binding protein [Sphingomonas sp.]
MSRILLDQARSIVAAALAKGQELGLKPLSVAVLDAGGHLIAFERQDGSSTLRPQIAIAKASGALALGVSSRKIGEMAAERPSFVASLGPLAPAGIVPVAGGVIVLGSDGLAIGAVGITGDTSDNDELCALAGVEAAGLAPQNIRN